MMRLIVAATALVTTMAASSPHHGRYKLLHKSSKAGKALQSSKSTKSVLGKSKSAGVSSADNAPALAHRPEASKSSKTTTEVFLPLEQPSSSPSMVVPESTSPHSVVSSTSSPTALATTPPQRPSHPIFTPHVNEPAPIKTETKPPSQFSTVTHNLFTPHGDGGHANDDSAAPSTTYDFTAPPAPSSTTRPSVSPYTNIPSVASSIMDPTASPAAHGLFGPNYTVSSTEDSPPTTTATPTPTATVDNNNIVSSNNSSNRPSAITITPPTISYEASSFSFTVILSSQMSFTPSSTPSFNPSFSSSGGNTFSNAPTTSKELNLLNPLSQGREGKVQVLSSMMVIMACAMAIMGTLYGVFRVVVMNKDEDSVLDEDGAQLTSAADFDADEFGNANNMTEGGGDGVVSNV